MKKLTRFQRNELANRAAEILNGILAVDPKALQALVNHRVECNEMLALHPTVQVLQKEGKYFVGLVGILNGVLAPMLGADIRINYKTDEHQKVIKFGVMFFPGA